MEGDRQLPWCARGDFAALALQFIAVALLEVGAKEVGEGRRGKGSCRGLEGVNFFREEKG